MSGGPATSSKSLPESNICVPSAAQIEVAIDEAVELAKTLSTDDSAGFVNGVLAKVAQQS